MSNKENNYPIASDSDDDKWDERYNRIAARLVLDGLIIPEIKEELSFQRKWHERFH